MQHKMHKKVINSQNHLRVYCLHKYSNNIHATQGNVKRREKLWEFISEQIKRKCIKVTLQVPIKCQIISNSKHYLQFCGSLRLPSIDCFMGRFFMMLDFY